MDLQKCLLHFEKIYGRPREYNVKQVMKPLYDRYRLVKRMMKMSDNNIECKLPPSTTVNPQTNGEHGNSATTVSSRSRGHSNVKLPEEDVIEIVTAKSKKEPFSTTISHDSNNQMSQSFTTANEGRSSYWRQSSSSGSWRSGAINMSQDNMNKNSSQSQNFNSGLRLVPTDPLSHNKHGLCGSNNKLKYQTSSVPLPVVDHPNSFTPAVPHTPIYSGYSSKSFNSSAEDIMQV